MRYTLSLILTLVLGMTSPGALAGVFGDVVPGAGVIHVKSSSVRAQRFTHLVRQHTDFSCGAAALATILRYSYHEPVTEQQVLKGLYRVSDPAVVEREGFSLLDIKRYVEARGMKAVGFRVPVAALGRLKVPAIVLLDLRGYEHFVVLRRVVHGRVYVADPALGRRTIPVAEFASEWNGIIFAVLGAHYDAANVLVRPRPPLGVSASATHAVAWPDGAALEFGTHAGLF